MACHYHPERESTDICAICGKPICKECGLEIAGKIYCKDCLQKIVGLSLDTQPQAQTVSAQDPIVNEPAGYEEQRVENIYDPQEETVYAAQEPITPETRNAIDDSPYNVRDNTDYPGGLESSRIAESESIPQEPQNVAPTIQQEQRVKQSLADDDFIYPDHSYEPAPTSARLDLEDKYEKYLDDLYFDEKEVPLEEQLAKDEEQFGSLTRKPYQPKEKPAQEQKIAKPSRPETPEEMEARIRAEILEEQGIKPKKSRFKRSESNENIHNLNYQEAKEPMGAVDILLSIILVIVILIVVYYLIYLFLLHSSYPTFMDAVLGLGNPQNVINNLLSSGG